MRADPRHQAAPSGAPEARPVGVVDVREDTRAHLVSVVVPAYNEQDAIGACVRSILSQTHEHLEVLVVDGASTDATRERVRELADEDARVRLIDNPDRRIPHGLNRALVAARGRWVVRVDAHATIPPDYVARAVEHLSSGRWGAVGGRKDGVGRTPAGRAVAAAMASRFGVGGSTYHHGTEPQTVEHVPFGAYPVELARVLGGWDEDLHVNQDFEFDHRVRRAGHEILFDPQLRIEWESRQSVGALWAQYHRYGHGKVKVMALHPESIALRHLVPPVLIVWLVAACLLAIWSFGAAALMVAPYALGVLGASVWVGRELDTWRERLALPSAFLSMHLAWGLGWWRGLPGALSFAWRRRV